MSNEPYRKPRWTAEEIRRIHGYAKMWAQAFNSDPFAYARVYKDMLAGVEMPSDIHSIAEGILNARARQQSFAATV